LTELRNQKAASSLKIIEQRATDDIAAVLEDMNMRTNIPKNSAKKPHIRWLFRNFVQMNRIPTGSTKGKQYRLHSIFRRVQIPENEGSNFDKTQTVEFMFNEHMKEAAKRGQLTVF
jgi:hypothetical protein